MKRDIIEGLAWAGGMIVLALGASFARNQGYIDQDMVLRLVIGINGLMIAYFGNRAPKRLAPSNCARQIARVSGWSSVVSGLIYTGLWIVAPIPVAILVGSCVIVAGLIVTIGYLFWLRGRDQKHGDTA